ncbi:MAG: MmcQ/YjbR family DNA-binding protein [Lactobacillus sp.]|jgi:predicted DNA-binding protein (MmcQ/YjbR family)|nr:MmcQ/YjbR family DNA-binding protein [Lactobacillus sp.]MCI2031951.1 MmcQ/YjbR family DNA-binding protein [Lactobacillus sp.]
MTRQELIAYCQNEYNAIVDKPFKHYPEYVAIRHQNGKWFGLVMNVPATKLGLPGTDGIKILDLKVDPELNSMLQIQPGFLPGYHMPKAHWLSVRLADFTTSQLADLIAGSYNATK